MRYDLAFFLCCCKSFLGSPEDAVDETNGESFYRLLNVDRDASQDEIKRAYRRESLKYHPDKIAQRGGTITEQDQAKFTRIKDAYECLSDPHKRETYDTIGERGMKWLDEPFSIDPQELAHNFAKSSVLDRSKIFCIFVIIAIAVLILPILICLHVDGVFGPTASWMATLVPLWIWNAFLLFYHTRVIMMGPIQRPDHIPPEEWVDPLPMKKRIFSMARFLLIVLFEVLLVLRMDEVLTCKWYFVCIPLYLWEATTLYKRWPLARMRIVTVEDLEMALGKPFSEFSSAEKELIGKRYSVVPSTASPEFEVAQKLKARARKDMMKSVFRILFVAAVLIQIDGLIDWNWWIVFAPFWLMTLLVCMANYHAFAEVQQMAAEKDPTLFGGAQKESSLDPSSPGATNYGSVGLDGTATPEATNVPPQSELSEEEREELKAAVAASGSKLCSKCCSQGCLLVLVCLFVAKLQGAGFSSFWIISPFLFAAAIILCCLGMAIFGITELPTDGVEFDTGDFAVGDSAESTNGAASAPPVDPELGEKTPTNPALHPSEASTAQAPPQPPEVAASNIPAATIPQASPDGNTTDTIGAELNELD